MSFKFNPFTGLLDYFTGGDGSGEINQTDAEIKIQYENNPNTNEYSDSEKAKLANIENNATADLTGPEIKSLYESESNTNAYTDSEKTKLAGLDSSKFLGEYISLAALQIAFPSPSVGSYANVDTGIGSDVVRYIWDNDDLEYILQLGTSTTLTDAQIKTQYENNPDTNNYSDSEKAKLLGIESGATGDLTGSEIKALYELEANAYTDVKNTKLDGIESEATQDQISSEVPYDNTASGLTAIDVKAALDEISSEVGIGGSPPWATSIGALSDVTISGALADNEILQYHAASSKWKNEVLATGGAVDSVNGKTGVVVIDPDDLDDTATTNKFTTSAEISKLLGIETGATADQDAINVPFDDSVILNGGDNVQTAIEALDTLIATRISVDDAQQVGIDAHTADLASLAAVDTDQWIDIDANTLKLSTIENNATADQNAIDVPFDDSVILNGGTNVQTAIEALDTLIETRISVDDAQQIGIDDLVGDVAIISASNDAQWIDIGANTAKLSGIEVGATADQTDAEITDAVQHLNATDDRDMKPNTSTIDTENAMKVFFGSEGGMTGAADSNYRDVIVLDTWGDTSGGDANLLSFDKDSFEINHYQATSTNSTWGTPKTLAYTDSDITGNASSATTLSPGTDRTKLDGIESGATADLTASEIKSLYESNSNTEVFDSTAEYKLSLLVEPSDESPQWDLFSGYTAGQTVRKITGNYVELYTCIATHTAQFFWNVTLWVKANDVFVMDDIGNYFDTTPTEGQVLTYTLSQSQGIWTAANPKDDINPPLRSLFVTWVSDDFYTEGDLVFRPSDGATVRCIEENSDVTYDAAKWETIDSTSSTEITYDNTISGLTATNVKTAIDEVAAAGGISDGGYELAQRTSDISTNFVIVFQTKDLVIGETYQIFFSMRAVQTTTSTGSPKKVQLTVYNTTPNNVQLIAGASNVGSWDYTFTYCQTFIATTTTGPFVMTSNMTNAMIDGGFGRVVYSCTRMPFTLVAQDLL